MNRVEMQKRCIFHKDSMCFLLSSKPTPCSLCYNFASTLPANSDKAGGGLHFLDEYLIESMDRDLIYPTGNKLQHKLQF